MATKTAKPVKKATKPTTKAAAKPAAPAKKEKVLNTCGCLSTVTVAGGEKVYSSCGAKVARRFAPGHDAKLKSLLIKTAVAGETIVVRDGGTRTEFDPAVMAKSLGWGGFVASAQEKAAKRASVVAARTAAKAAKPAKKATKPATKASAKSSAKPTKKATKPAASPEVVPTPGAHPVVVNFGTYSVDANVDAEVGGDKLLVSYTFQGTRKTGVEINRSQVQD